MLLLQLPSPLPLSVRFTVLCCLKAVSEDTCCFLDSFLLSIVPAAPLVPLPVKLFNCADADRPLLSVDYPPHTFVCCLGEGSLDYVMICSEIFGGYFLTLLALGAGDGCFDLFRPLLLSSSNGFSFAS